jgi:hypothetical protein
MLYAIFVSGSAGGIAGTAASLIAAVSCYSLTSLPCACFGHLPNDNCVLSSSPGAVIGNGPCVVERKP